MDLMTVCARIILQRNGLLFGDNSATIYRKIDLGRLAIFFCLVHHNIILRLWGKEGREAAIEIFEDTSWVSGEKDGSTKG